MTTEQTRAAGPLDQTREQRYAGVIHQQVVAFRDATAKQEDRDAYKAMVQSLPVLVRTAGLAQALAFVNTRGKEPQRLILTHLDTLLRESMGEGQTLLELSRAARLGEYMYLTRQVMGALLWYKRFAEWLLDKDRAEAAQTPPGPLAAGQAQPDAPLAGTEATP